MSIEKGQVWRTASGRPSEKSTYVIVAVHEIGDTTYVWHTLEGEDECMISVSENAFLYYAERVPDFFEEKKTYQQKVSGDKYTVRHVHELSKGKVAVAQHTSEYPAFFLQRDWDSGIYLEV